MAKLRLTQRAGLGEPASAPENLVQLAALSRKEGEEICTWPSLTFLLQLFNFFSFGRARLQRAGASISGHFQNLFCLRRMGGRGGRVWGEGRCRSVPQAKPKPTSHALPLLQCRSLLLNHTLTLQCTNGCITCFALSSARLTSVPTTGRCPQIIGSFSPDMY